MFNLGFPEMVVIGVLALILIGPKQLPEVARTVGRFLNDLKRSTDGLKDEFNAELHRIDDQVTKATETTKVEQDKKDDPV